MSDPSVGISLFLAGLGSLYLVWRYLTSDRRRWRWRLRRLRRTPIADAKSGTVKLVGRVRILDRDLTAPLTERRCVAWRVQVDQSIGDGSKTIIDDWRAIDFLLDDGAAVASIRVETAELELSLDGHRSSGFMNDAPEHIEAFLARHGKKSTTLFGAVNRSLQYAEGALEPDKEIVVCGTARWEPDPDPRNAQGYRETPMRLIVEAELLSDDRALVDT
jgi:hypothetical protein